MTISELIERLNDLGVSGDEEIRIAAFGGMRQGKSLGRVSIGFDWDNGAVILHPVAPLTIKGPPKPGCKHTSVHWRVNPEEPQIGRSVEVCNECGLSRSHWEQGCSGWCNAEIDDFPPCPRAL